MEYDMSRFVADFSERTIANLKTIEELHNEKKLVGDKYDLKAYEVTQLINSMVGLLIIPYEKYKFRSKRYNTDAVSLSENDLKKINCGKEYDELKSTIDSLYKEGKVYSSYDYDKYFPVSQFIYHLRNAISHSGDGGIGFYPFAKTNIDGLSHIILHDKEDEREFVMLLEVEEISCILTTISHMYSSVSKVDFDDKEEKLYNEKIKKLLGKLSYKITENKG